MPPKLLIRSVDVVLLRIFQEGKRKVVDGASDVLHLERQVVGVTISPRPEHRYA